ncbi:hypothetical protein NG796_00050 [Laspinema sp. A4]|uniref:hypothetical protein n=1 Tax=Laspinema sp. D2d TaxID=2953686 RepID=UPI0021BA6D16|nr:hypothetical protein [Laspinema sp. D2d]MCT7981675.1 hypothetical protein [Laspinema sp. D2d]
MTDDWMGLSSQAGYRVWFWLMRSVWEIGVNFSRKNISGVNIFTNRGKPPVATQQVMESLVE